MTTRVLLNPYRRSILVPSAIPLENKRGAARSSFRELMQRRRRGQRERHKSTKQQLCTCIITISLPLFHDYNVKPSSFSFYEGREHETTIFFRFLFLNLDTVL